MLTFNNSGRQWVRVTASQPWHLDQQVQEKKNKTSFFSFFFLFYKPQSTGKNIFFFLHVEEKPFGLCDWDKTFVPDDCRLEGRRRSSTLETSRDTISDETTRSRMNKHNLNPDSRQDEEKVSLLKFNTPHYYLISLYTNIKSSTFQLECSETSSKFYIKAEMNSFFLTGRFCLPGKKKSTTPVWFKETLRRRPGGLLTWQLVGGVMVVRPVILDERRHRRDVAGVHGRHAGSSADGGGLVVQVQHSEGATQEKRRWGYYDFTTGVECFYYFCLFLGALPIWSLLFFFVFLGF